MFGSRFLKLLKSSGLLLLLLSVGSFIVLVLFAWRSVCGRVHLVYSGPDYAPGTPRAVRVSGWVGAGFRGALVKKKRGDYYLDCYCNSLLGIGERFELRISVPDGEKPMLFINDGNGNYVKAYRWRDWDDSSPIPEVLDTRNPPTPLVLSPKEDKL